MLMILPSLPRSLSTNFTPKVLSKLTVRKFHICQKWLIGTNSSHGVKFAKCEICGSTELILYTNRHHLNQDPTSMHIWRASLVTEQYLTLYYSTGRTIIGRQRNSTIVLMGMRQQRDDERWEYLNQEPRLSNNFLAQLNWPWDLNCS